MNQKDKEKFTSIVDSFIQEAIKTESVDFVEIARRLTLPRTIRLLHAGMGMITEGAEFLDALKKFIFYGKDLDLVNLKEELGDNNWYQAIAMDELGTNYEEILTTVIKKLRSRYNVKPNSEANQFNRKNAIERNLVTEREILENKELLHFAPFAGKLNPVCNPPAGKKYFVTSNFKFVTCQDCINTARVKYPVPEDSVNEGKTGCDGSEMDLVETLNAIGLNPIVVDENTKFEGEEK